MAVPMRQAVAGGLEPRAPVALFPPKVGGAVQDLSSALYMVSSDGKRFLMNTLLEDVSGTPITLIVNRRPRP